MNGDCSKTQQDQQYESMGSGCRRMGADRTPPCWTREEPSKGPMVWSRLTSVDLEYRDSQTNGNSTCSCSFIGSNRSDIQQGTDNAIGSNKHDSANYIDACLMFTAMTLQVSHLRFHRP